MMNSMQEKVLGWIGKEHPLVEDNIIPPVATMPDPKPPTDEDQKLAVIAEAHVFVDQLRQERAADRGQIEDLQAEVGNLAHALQGERRKSGLLELDLAEAHNNVQTLQSQIEEYRHFMNVWRDMHDKTRSVFDRFGIKGKPKVERKAKPKKEKTNRKEATATPATDER